MTVVNIPAKSTPARMTLSMIRTMPTAISLLDLFLGMPEQQHEQAVREHHDPDAEGKV